MSTNPEVRVGWSKKAVQDNNLWKVGLTIFTEDKYNKEASETISQD